MSVTLWIIASVLAVAFLAAGAMKLLTAEGEARCVRNGMGP